jgi:hypothetical protein
VVQIAAWMLNQDQDAGWITERELLRDELAAARDPDGRLRRARDADPTACSSEPIIGWRWWRSS